MVKPYKCDNKNINNSQELYQYYNPNQSNKPNLYFSPEKIINDQSNNNINNVNNKEKVNSNASEKKKMSRIILNLILFNSNKAQF